MNPHFEELALHLEAACEALAAAAQTARAAGMRQFTFLRARRSLRAMAVLVRERLLLRVHKEFPEITKAARDTNHHARYLSPRTPSLQKRQATAKAGTKGGKATTGKKRAASRRNLEMTGKHTWHDARGNEDPDIGVRRARRVARARARKLGLPEDFLADSIA